MPLKRHKNRSPRLLTTPFFFFQNIFKNVLFKWIQTFLPLLILTFLLEGEVFCEVPALVVPSKEEQRFGMIYL